MDIERQIEKLVPRARLGGIAFFWISFAAIVTFALVLRLYDIEARPLHSDESVNWHFVREMRHKGFYSYSHENYHGPAHFWLVYACTRIFGLTVLGLRMSSILLGTALIGLLLPLRRVIGDTFVLLAGIFLALSPSLVFYSRYAIHETLLAFGTVLIAVSLYMFFHSARLRYVLFGLLGLAVVISTKETFVVNCFCLGIGILSFGRTRQCLTLIRRSEEAIAWAYLCSAFLVFSIFSSAFYEIKGLRELLLGFFQWLGRGTVSDVGHFKPFHYFWRDVIHVTEPYLVTAYKIFAIIAAWHLFTSQKRNWFSFLKAEHRLGRYLFLWSASSFLVYSLIPYKTTWLVINIALPAILFTAWLLAYLLESHYFPARLLGLFFFGWSIFAAAVNVWFYNYSGMGISSTSWRLRHTEPYGPENPFSYVHTAGSAVKLASDVKSYCTMRNGARVSLGASSYWPLPFYLSETTCQLGYARVEDPEAASQNAEVLVLDKQSTWRNENWERREYRLHDGAELAVYFRMQN